ncbi:MAG TPA: Mur ligase family protein, partial [Verrucomicrobiae bacterium]|nr:Mur ligase family protein [Verrucomicrobiae bacterium]
MNPKKLGKSIVCHLLEAQVKRLRHRNQFTIVAVVGSVGKTSTKLAIAKTLATSRRVAYQDGNYNDRLTVPLVLFGQTEPGIYNLFAWFKILRANRRKLRQPFPYDVAILELGPDRPGQMREFAYLQPEICVVTAIADEHMEYFKTLDAVAQEELVSLDFSKQVLLNTDDIPTRYVPKSAFTSYGLDGSPDYAVTHRQPRGLQGQQLTVRLPGDKQLTAEVSALGSQGAKIALAAVAVADLLEVPTDQIAKSLSAITPVS